MIQRISLSLCALLMLLASACQSQPLAGPHAAQMVHHVYFTLREDTEAARAALVVACHTSLAGLPGITYFSAGTRDETIEGPANDREFDVALLVVFENRAALDHYQKSPEHVAFVEAQRPNWQTVRVFDARESPR